MNELSVSLQNKKSPYGLILDIKSFPLIFQCCSLIKFKYPFSTFLNIPLKFLIFHSTIPCKSHCMIKLTSFYSLKMEKALATHSSTLAWKLLWIEEPGGLQSMGSLRVGHNCYFTFTFHFHALEKEMATHSSVLAWRISGPWEPGGLPSLGSYRVGHD